MAGHRHHHGVSIVSLGFRPGAVVALSIPLTVAIIFPIMEFIGIDLQRISLGALIIALGLLVDDAMTTVDVMISRMAAGDSKEKAATVAYDLLAFPMLTGSFITAAGFVPIGFAKSSAGEYTFSIFAVVSIALIVSWFVAVLFAPLLGVWLLKVPEKKTEEKPSRIDGGVPRCCCGDAPRWITIAVTLGFFTASLLALPLVPRQFFPASDRPELVVDLTLPQNASIFATDRAAAKLDAILKDNPDVASWSTYVGRGAIRFYLPLNVQLANDSSRRPWSSPRMFPRGSGCTRRSRRNWPRTFPAPFPGSRRWSWARRWAGRCNIASAVPISAKCAAISLQLGAILGSTTTCAGGEFRLDGARPQGARRDRPGSGPFARASARRRFRPI